MTISCEGDLGDAVYVLGILQELHPQPHDFLLQQSTITKMRTGDAMASFERLFKPLAESQSYIRECRLVRAGDEIEWHSGGFRSYGIFSPTCTLLENHVNHLVAVKGIGQRISGVKKWIHVEPSKESEDAVIVSRTNRYQNARFPWAEVADKYFDRILFVGLYCEWRWFCEAYGEVKRKEISDLLELAQIIAGSALFIGNQSCANAIAEGLKHPMVQETCPQLPDCIYERENARHVVSRACVLPGLDGDEDTYIDEHPLLPASIRKMKTPAGGWQYKSGICPKYPPQHVLRAMVNEVVSKEGGNYEEVEKRVIQYNIDRTPESFTNPYSISDTLFRAAQENAKRAIHPPPKVTSHFKHPVSR